MADDNRIWFTYAINDELRHKYNRWCKDTGNPCDVRPAVDSTGCALVFPGHSAELIRRISDEPFIGEIADGAPLWFVPTGRVTVVAPHPTFFSVNYRTAPPGAVIGVKTEKHGLQLVPLNDVLENCFRIERIAENCIGCDIEYSCVDYNFGLYLRKAGLDKEKFSWPPDSNTTWELDNLVDDEEPLAPYLRKMSKQSLCRFTSPRNTVDHSFSPSFVCANEVEFDSTLIEKSRQKASDAARLAARTRKALRRCKGCYFHPCDRSTDYHGRYYGDPGKCQGLPDGRTWASDTNTCTPGPYSEEQILPAFMRWWDGDTTLTREQIAFVAYNAGCSVRMWDRSVVLGRCNTELTKVRFYYDEGRGVMTDLVLTWDEAMTLLRTPTRRSDGTYAYTQLREPDEMPWPVLHLYAEICQHENLSHYGWLDQEVCWWRCGRGFEITARHESRRAYSHTFHVSDLKQLSHKIRHFGRMPTIFAENVLPLVNDAS